MSRELLLPVYSGRRLFAVRPAWTQFLIKDNARRSSGEQLRRRVRTERNAGIPLN